MILNPAGQDPFASEGSPTVQLSPVSAAFGTQALNLIEKAAEPFCGIVSVDGSIVASTLVKVGPISAA